MMSNLMIGKINNYNLNNKYMFKKLYYNEMTFYFE